MGEILHVKINQYFANTAAKNAEYIYTFPLPDQASVCHFSALVGDRRITGEIKEKEQAYRLYEQAVTAGDSAYLLESARANIYQVNLGNVKAGEAVEIEIAYLQSLQANDDELRIMVPTLVAPRYIPGQKSGAKKGMGTADPTDQVPDADFITPPIGNPDYRATIHFQINPGRKIATIESPSHRITAHLDQAEAATVELADQKTLLDRDFILKVKLIGEPLTRCLIGKTGLDEWFALATFTPELAAAELTEDAEYVFLIDISGSMEGIKLDQAKTALKICLRNLGSEDTFKLAAFESDLHVLSQNFMPYDQKHLDQATKWIDQLHAMGGTEILSAIKFALQDKSENERLIIILTDGEVGNEREIVRTVEDHNENVRIFSIGIDTSVNSLFINQIAEAGNGAAEFVYPGENVDDKIIRHFSRIHAQILQNARFRFDGSAKIDIAGEKPEKLYDLEPYTLAARLDHGPINRVVVEGYVNDQKQQIEISDVIELENPDVLAKLWAKKQIERLEHNLITVNPRRSDFLRTEIISLSEKYSVASTLTSFVAVYEREDKLIALPQTSVIPVSEPADWDMMDRSFRPLILDVNRSYSSAKFASNTLARSDMFYRCISSSSNFEGEKKLSNAPIKQLAVSQNYDGSFGDSSQDTHAQIIQTLKAVTEFLTSGIDIQLYRRQISKALNYLLSQATEILKHEATALAFYLILQHSLQSAGFNRMIPSEVLENLKTSLSHYKVLQDLTSKNKLLDIKQLKAAIKQLK